MLRGAEHQWVYHVWVGVSVLAQHQFPDYVQYCVALSSVIFLFAFGASRQAFRLTS